MIKILLKDDDDVEDATAISPSTAFWRASTGDLKEKEEEDNMRTRTATSSNFIPSDNALAVALEHIDDEYMTLKEFIDEYPKHSSSVVDGEKTETMRTAVDPPPPPVEEPLKYIYVYHVIARVNSDDKIIRYEDSSEHTGDTHFKHVISIAHPDVNYLNTAAVNKIIEHFGLEDTPVEGWPLMVENLQHKVIHIEQQSLEKKYKK